MPLIRTPRTLPRVLAPGEVDALRAALRTHRDRAMVDAMVLGGLRRCEVLGLRLEDLSAGERRLFVAEGKGGRERVVPVSARFFAAVGAYLESERPAAAATRQVFVVLKGARRGEPLSPAGLDEILDGARRRAGLDRATCHQLRHTCFTRLREAGMALEAIQAQAGHASIESTRLYLHLANDWLEKEYLRAAEAIEAQAAPVGLAACDERVTGPAPRRGGPGRRLPRRPGGRRDVRRPPGYVGRPHVLHPGRGRRVGRLPLAAQCALPLKDRRVVGWLIVTGRLRPSADYLVALRPYLGEVAAHHHRAFYERFAEPPPGSASALP